MSISRERRQRHRVIRGGMFSVHFRPVTHAFVGHQFDGRKQR